MQQVNSANNQTDLIELDSDKVPPWEGFREAFILHLADNALILAQRNSEWCGHGPVLEQDIAITNISLDLLGQARNLYQYAALLINKKSNNSLATSLHSAGKEVTEDCLSFLRSEREFKNCLLVEQPNGNWGYTILRQYLFSVYQYLLYGQLQNSKDENLAAIAAKSLKEVTYHVRWSSEWVIRLGDGTAESHNKMVQALEEIWSFTGELFLPEPYENEIVTGFNLVALQQSWLQQITNVLEEATLLSPALNEKAFMQRGGKKGLHTEHMGYILAELQYMQRAYPGAEW